MKLVDRPYRQTLDLRHTAGKQERGIKMRGKSARNYGWQFSVDMVVGDNTGTISFLRGGTRYCAKMNSDVRKPKRFKKNFFSDLVSLFLY